MLKRRWGGGREPAEDLVFDGELSGVGKLVTIRAEDLDAVVLPGIVRGRDDDAGSKSVGARQEGDGRCGDDAGALDRGSASSQASRKRSGNPCA